jgi:predicted dehydrogenase
VRQAKQIINSGRLGPLQTIRATWNSPRDPDTLPEWRRHRALGGGSLVEVAGDHFDLWRYLLDAEIGELFAMTTDGRWEDEAAVLSGRMANGILVSAVFSERANHDLEIEICGQAGRLRVACIRFEGLEYYTTDTMPSSLPARLRRIGHFMKELPRALPRMHRAGDYRASYCDQWRQFHESVRTGKPMESTLRDGRQALAAVLAAARSSVEGRPVKVGDAPPGMTLPRGSGAFTR